MPLVRRSLFVVCALAFLAGTVRGELAQPMLTEPTVPGITVRPNTQPDVVQPYPGMGYGYNFDGGPISWDSDLIQSYSTPVGPYGQPQWTVERAFPASRAYVLPEGTYELEQWVRPTWKKDGTTEYRFLEEIAIGLPCRFQLDIYERWNSEPDDNGNQVANHEGVQIELRWALADWGVIPFNPTLYAEWIERGGPQEKPNKYELKLLLSEQFGDYLFFATNLILEQEVADEEETELAWSWAFGTPIIDNKLMGTIEMRYAQVTVEGSRNDPSYEFLIGPGIQWKPTNRTFIDVVGLFGTTPESPTAQMYIVFGYQFGNRAGPLEVGRPASGRGN